MTSLRVCLFGLVLGLGASCFEDSNGTTSGGDASTGTTTGEDTGVTSNGESSVTTDASTSVTTDASTSTTTDVETGMESVDTGNLGCDDADDCTACSNCAVSDECADQWADCEADPNCAAASDCLADCGDNEACAQGCFDMYPVGIATLLELTACFCEACTQTCAINCA